VQINIFRWAFAVLLGLSFFCRPVRAECADTNPAPSQANADNSGHSPSTAQTTDELLTSLDNQTVVNAPTALDATANADSQATASTQLDRTTDGATDDVRSSASTNSQKTAPTSTMKRLGSLLKANIEETFELDPRLKKDLTQGDPELRPITLMQDYFSVAWNPSYSWTQQSGTTTNFTHSQRTLALYIMPGAYTKHLSGWFQMTPMTLHPKGFLDPEWEMFQGLANYGTDKNTVQFRGGQTFNWQNQGWGGADRTITQTSPGVYTAFNGWDPSSVSKAISLALTGAHWTSARVFGYWQQNAGTSSDSNIAFHNHGEGVGIAMEKLFGETGISGVQSVLTMGNSPVFNANIPATQHSPFISWIGWANKSFQDRRGYVRVNPSVGVTVFGVKRNIDDPTLPESRSRGVGVTVDLLTIPVVSYWATILRYDMFKPTNLIGNRDNITHTFTIGQALDFHGPNQSRIRVTFDYQLVGQVTTKPINRFIVGVWPIW
jgi:hypothetical protein